MKIQQGSESFSVVVSLPFGKLAAKTADGLVQQLLYLPQHYEEKAPQDDLAAAVADQVQRYCMNPDFQFDLPLAPVGTAFQRKVWDTIATIPRGSVRTYGELARHIGSAAQAVGQACGGNYFPLVVPCHRVTAAQGLGGFANSHDPNGYLLNIKRWLLAHEGSSEYAWRQTTLL